MFTHLTNKMHYWATPIYDRLPTQCFPQRALKFKAYGVGTAKSGTVSLYLMFKHRHYRAAHEADSRFLIYKILASINGKIDEATLTRYVKHRDRRLGLEMDSSNLNYYLLDILVREFEEAKFILTIRDCYSWLDSYINLQLNRPELQNWWRIHVKHLVDFEFGAHQFKHVKAEKVLSERGLHTLDGYLSYWAKHNHKVLTTVPAERLLVIKTQNINQDVPKIEAFLGLPTGTLPKRVHGNIAPRKFHLLAKIDRAFLEDKVKIHCQSLMRAYFPEIKDFESSCG